MLGLCPYSCKNKTANGYCRTTGCINPNYSQVRVIQKPSYEDERHPAAKPIPATPDYWPFEYA